jgi:hypothetical protein
MFTKLKHLYLKINGLPGICVPVEEIVVQEKFPVFETLPQETEYQRGIRWENTRNELNRLQHLYIVHRVCHTFVNIWSRLMDHELNDAITRRQIQKHLFEEINTSDILNNFSESMIICDELLNTPEVIDNNGIVVGLNYRMHASFKSHNVLISNKEFT